MDNTLGSKKWFDLDLWTYDLKINRDHLLIEGNPCTIFGIDQMKGSKDIKRTTLGLQTDRPTDRPTYQPTDSCKATCPPFLGGHKYWILLGGGGSIPCLWIFYDVQYILSIYYYWEELETIKLNLCWRRSW